MTVGLVMFLSVLALDVLGVVADLLLRLLGWPTITALVREHPPLGEVILFLQGIAAVGLYFHFFGQG